MKNPNILSKSIAILSAKGGTGKSQIAVSLGYSLANCDFKTLLIDLDLFTHGMTFYSLAGVLNKPKHHLMDYFTGKCAVSELEPIQLMNEFSNKRLHVLPNINRKRDYLPELQVNKNFSDLNSFKRLVNSLIDQFSDKFNYIIVDTRGGTDFTTIAAAQCTDGHIIITEADKPSWDTGRVLLDSIYSVESSYKTLGFVLNKNVLPSEAIEMFLRKEWETKHLATIGLDSNAVKYFQEDKIPVAEDLGSDFSVGILEIIQKSIFADYWNDQCVSNFELLQNESKKLVKKARYEKDLKIMGSKFSWIFKSYVLIILFILFYFQKQDLINNDFFKMLFEDDAVYITIFVLFIFSFILDSRFINPLIKILFAPFRRLKQNK